MYFIRALAFSSFWKAGKTSENIRETLGMSRGSRSEIQN